MEDPFGPRHRLTTKQREILVTTCNDVFEARRPLTKELWQAVAETFRKRSGVSYRHTECKSVMKRMRKNHQKAKRHQERDGTRGLKELEAGLDLWIEKQMQQPLNTRTSQEDASLGDVDGVGLASEPIDPGTEDTAEGANVAARDEPVRDHTTVDSNSPDPHTARAKVNAEAIERMLPTRMTLVDLTLPQNYIHLTTALQVGGRAAGEILGQSIMALMHQVDEQQILIGQLTERQHRLDAFHALTAGQMDELMEWKSTCDVPGVPNSVGEYWHTAPERGQNVFDDTLDRDWAAQNRWSPMSASPIRPLAQVAANVPGASSGKNRYSSTVFGQRSYTFGATGPSTHQQTAGPTCSNRRVDNTAETMPQSPTVIIERTSGAMQRPEETGTQRPQSQSPPPPYTAPESPREATQSNPQIITEEREQRMLHDAEQIRSLQQTLRSVQETCNMVRGMRYDTDCSKRL